jgi:hypothetical protein
MTWRSYRSLFLSLYELGSHNDRKWTGVTSGVIETDPADAGPVDPAVGVSGLRTLAFIDSSLTRQGQ